MHSRVSAESRSRDLFSLCARTCWWHFNILTCPWAYTDIYTVHKWSQDIVKQGEKGGNQFDLSKHGSGQSFPSVREREATPMVWAPGTSLSKRSLDRTWKIPPLALILCREFMYVDFVVTRTKNWQFRGKGKINRPVNFYVILSPVYFSGCSNRHDRRTRSGKKLCLFFSQICETNKHIFSLLQHIPT